MPFKFHPKFETKICPDGKRRSFRPRKDQPFSNRTYGYVNVQEPKYKINSAVPGWVWDSNPDYFYPEPQSKNSGIFTELIHLRDLAGKPIRTRSLHDEVVERLGIESNQLSPEDES